MNEPPAIAELEITADDLRKSDWQAVTETAAEHDCIHYYGPFFTAAEALKVAGDFRGEKIQRVLGLVAAASLPGQQGSSTRPIDDLPDGTLNALAAVLPEMVDAEMRAKVADVLWYRTKNHTVLPQAVDAYLKSAHNLWDVANWPASVERIERALKLGRILGKAKPYYAKVLSFMEDTLRAHEDDDVGLASEHLMGLLYAYKEGDPARYSLLCGKIAQRLADSQNWHFARRYWQLKVAWDQRNGDAESSAASALAAAETYVSEAEGVATSESKPSYFSAAHWMTKGVQALRDARADPLRIAYAHKKLLEYQRIIVEHEMNSMEPSAGELPWLHETGEKMVRMAREIVAQRSLPDAVVLLGWVVSRPVDPAELRTRVEKHAKKFISNHIIESSTLSATGKVTDTKPPISPVDAEQTEEALRKEMFQQAREIDWQFKVNWQINPAREQLGNEHPLTLRDLSFLVMDNPFIPRGRENIFLRGLHAGFAGDFLLATHLLLPQLEHAIRQALENHGVITSKLESDKTQDERDLGWLLTQPEMEKVFGDDITFDLRGVLIERFGHNLRNEVAHGLLSELAFHAPPTIYAWWLILRICTSPFLPVETKFDLTSTAPHDP